MIGQLANPRCLHSPVFSVDHRNRQQRRYNQRECVRSHYMISHPSELIGMIEDLDDPHTFHEISVNRSTSPNVIAK